MWGRSKSSLRGAQRNSILSRPSPSSCIRILLFLLLVVTLVAFLSITSLPSSSPPSSSSQPPLHNKHQNDSATSSYSFSKKRDPLAIKKSWMIKQKNKKGQDLMCDGHKRVQYLVSFPKAGRTWLRFMTASYLSSLYNLTFTSVSSPSSFPLLDFDSLFGIIPNQLCPHLPDRCTYLYCSHPILPLLIASHSPFEDSSVNFSFSNQRLVLLVRNVWDTMASYYFHLLNSNSIPVNSSSSSSPFSLFLRSQLESYLHHLNSHFDHLHQTRDVLLLTYESLRKNPRKGLQDIIAFYRFPFSQSAFEYAITASSFENMLKVELGAGTSNDTATSSEGEGAPGGNGGEKQVEGMKKKKQTLNGVGAELLLKDPNKRRVRQGKVLDSLKFYSQEDILFVQRTCQEILSRNSIAILTNLGLWQLFLTPTATTSSPS